MMMIHLLLLRNTCPRSSMRFGSLRERLLRLSDLYTVAKTFKMSGNGDFDSETVYGKPVQVISIDENENTFSLNEENQFGFIQDTCKNETICCQRCWRF